MGSLENVSFTWELNITLSMSRTILVLGVRAHDCRRELLHITEHEEWHKTVAR